MVKRESRSKAGALRPTALEKHVVALAERMGRTAGRMHAAVDSLRSTRLEVRDKDRTSASAAARSAGTVAAPGKKHRKAPPRLRGVKHSQQSIAKVASRKQTRPPRRG
jgi:hypothetical protein